MGIYEKALDAYKTFDRVSKESNNSTTYKNQELANEIGQGSAVLIVHSGKDNENLRLTREVQVC